MKLQEIRGQKFEITSTVQDVLISEVRSPGIKMPGIRRHCCQQECDYKCVIMA